MEQQNTSRGKTSAVITIILAVLLVVALAGCFLLWRKQQNEQADSHAKAVSMCQTAAKGVEDPEPCDTSLSDDQLASNTAANYSKATDAEKSAADAAKKAAQQAEDRLKKAQEAAKGMDLAQLAKGDYSSVQGTWKNANGDTMVIVGDKITKTGTADKDTLTFSNVILPYKDENIGEANLAPNSQDSPMGMILVPKGVAVTDPEQPGEKDLSDTTKDRISFSSNGPLETYISSTGLDLKNIFYRVE